MAKRQRAKLWGDGRIYRKTRLKADGSTYEEPRWWLQYSVDGQVRRESSGTDDAVKAQRMLDKRVHAIRNGEVLAPNRNVRLSDLRDRHLAKYDDKHLDSKDSAVGRWKNLLGYFDGDRKALSLTTDEMAAYGRHRDKRGAEGATINKEWNALKAGFRLAIKARALSAMPGFPEPRPENIRTNFITLEQRPAIQAYLAAVEPASADCFAFAMVTGWRKGQILSLEWRDIHEAEIRAIPDRTKTDIVHCIPITAEVREILDRRRAARVVGSPWVFCRKDGSRILNFRKAWASATKAAGCPETLFHDSRRSAARAHRDAGIPETVSMGLTGHKTNAMWKRYAITNQDDLRKALDALASTPVVTAPRKVAPKRHHRRVVAMAGRRK